MFENEFLVKQMETDDLFLEEKKEFYIYFVTFSLFIFEALLFVCYLFVI